MRRITAGFIILSVLLLAFSFEALAAVRKGPYLIYGGDPSSMMVLWQLDSPQICTIRWGLTAQYSSGTASVEPYGDTQYEHTMTALLPGTLYYYQVDGVGSGSFRTAPDSTATSVKLLAFSDPQGPPEGFNGASARMIDTFTQDPSYQTLGICAGDRADEDDETIWDTQYFSRAWENILLFLARIPIAGPRGNHERGGIVFKKYYPYSYVNDFYWSFDYGPVHIIVLDQFVSYAPGSPQYGWLVSDLAATNKPWKIITFHMPGWSADNVHENDLDVQAYIQPLCLQYGIDLVISGHNHYYARADVSGIQHLTTGGASDYFSVPGAGDYIVQSAGTPHHLEIDIQGREASITARRRDGSAIETFTISHGASVRLTLPQAGSTLLAGQATNVRARVLTAGGTCTGVLFYADGQLIGTDETEPYDVAWIPTNAVSSVSLVAETVIDYLGSRETISSVPVTVNITNTPPPQIFIVQVSQSTDDAEESASGSMSLTSSDLELVYDSSNQQVGMRFNGVVIPRGVTITNAYVQFTINEANSENTLLTVQGEKVDQAVTFDSLKYNISSRSKTAAAVSWSPSPWATVGAAGADQRTPDITSVIQEIVNRPGWSSGNSLAIIITGTGHRTADAYDHGKGWAPWLHIEYLAPSGNRAPAAVADTYSTNEDAALVVGGPGVLSNDIDVDGNSLTAILNTGPSHGSVTLNPSGGFTYSPSANFNGTDTFTYHANDGQLDSGISTVMIIVTPVNDAPVANAQSVTTAVDTPLAITLTGSDVDSGTLTYSVVVAPAHGTLNGSTRNLIYTPNANFTGSDNFTFRAYDGQLYSADATVSVAVAAGVNNPPVANSQSVTTAEDTARSIVLSATDMDGDPFTYVVVTSPGHGTLGGAVPNLTYTPAANYYGSDSFTFKANDGKADSNVATVSISITAVNDPPVANAQSVTTAEDTAKSITLQAADVENAALTYTVLAGPSHGTLSGSAPSLSYMPAANYNGSDSFTFKANDGAADSNVAAVSIAIAAVNDPPVANAQSVTTAEDTAKSITLQAADVENAPLTYTVLAGPSHGTLSGSAPSLSYMPAANYNGSDSFTFKANDGAADSNVATVSISIAPVNDPPVANAQSVTTVQNTAKAITLTGSDVDSSSLSYNIVVAPAHGTLSGSNQNLTYTPAANYNGPDGFNFQISDGALPSNVAAVSITVTAVNQAPVVSAGADLTTVPAARAQLNGTATDDNLPSGTLTVNWGKVSGPGSATFGNAAMPSTTAKFSKVGIYVLRLTASDGALASSDDVTVTVVRK